MSVAEMAALLESREIDDEVAAAEIARLEAVGLLDDQALAETLVRTLRERKGLGKSAIASELRRRAIDPAVALDALELVDPDDELTRAIEVAHKRAAQLRSYDPVTAKRRLYAYLQRRGYSGQVLSQAVDAALGSGRQTGPRFS
jgi:regulatory protein